MLICHFDETNSSGGLDKQARLLAETLISDGVKLCVLSSTRARSNRGWRLDGRIPTRLFWTYHSPQISGRYLPAALLWAFQVFIWLWLNRREVDLIHCHQLRIHSFVAALAKVFFGIPNIQKSAVGGHGADIRVIGSRKYFGRIGRRFVIDNCDAFVAISNSIFEDLVKYGCPASSIEVVPNGIDLSKFGFSIPSDSLRRCKRLVYVGRLAEDKNVLALIEAARVELNGSDFTLEVFGKGPLVDLVKHELEERPTENVFYRGFVSDTNELLSRMGFLVLPSSGEGLSNAMLEAMGSGVVPVVTRVSGCIDHIYESVNGMFIDGVSVGEIRGAIRRVIDVSEADWSRMSVATSAYARERFDIKVVSYRYRELYSRLTCGGKEGWRNEKI